MSVRLLLCFILLLAAANGICQLPPTTLQAKSFLTMPGASWKLRWSDEFDGTALDTTKWTIGLPWVGDDGTNRHHNNQYASYIMDDDVEVRGGSLHLTTHRRDVVNPSGKHYSFTEGFITTYGKFETTYGYFEMRAILPVQAGPGTWPAFWMLSEGWPPEMDILEYWGSDSRIHQGTVTRAPNGSQNWQSYHKNSVSLSGWHTYGLEWGPGYQIYNIDCKKTNAIYGGHLPRVPHYLLLNSGIESSRPPTASTTFPNDFIVDYVRVYDRPDLPALLNGDFESDDMRPWERWHEAAVVDYNAHSGHRALRLDPAGPENASSAQQTVFGLKTGALYRLTAQAKTTHNALARLGVKEYGIEETRSDGVKSNGYRRLKLDFTVGKEQDSATIYCWAEGDGTVYFDDVRLVELTDANEFGKGTK